MQEQEVELRLNLRKGDRVWGLTTDEIKALIERPSDVEIIRAFVERVEVRRWDLLASSSDPWGEAVYAELTAMEKENA